MCFRAESVKMVALQRPLIHIRVPLKWIIPIPFFPLTKFDLETLLQNILLIDIPLEGCNMAVVAFLPLINEDKLGDDTVPLKLAPSVIPWNTF